MAAGFGTLIAGAVGATLWIALSAGWENAIRLIEISGDSILDAVVMQVERQLNASVEQTAFISDLVNSGELDLADAGRLQDIMLGSLAAAQEINAIAYADLAGELTVVGRLDDGRLIRFREQWQDDPGLSSIVRRIENNDVAAWEGVIWMKRAGEPGLLYIQPLRRDGNYQGFIASVVSLRNLSRLLERIGESEAIRAFILTASGKVLAHHNFAANLTERSPASPLPGLSEVGDPILALYGLEGSYKRLEKKAQSSDLADGRVVEKDDIGAVFFTRNVVGFGPDVWTFGIYSPLESVQRWQKVFIWALFFGLGILGLAILLAVLLSRTISRPFMRFAEVSGAIRDLNIGAARPLGRTYLSELNHAAGAYNSMLGALRWFELYLPRRLVLRLLRQGEEGVKSEERIVTVLFTDIVGFTTIASKLTPAELAQLLNQHFALISEAIEEEGGTIDKYIGDSIMAFWGAPDDQPDHAQRAARAVLKASRLLAEDNARRLAQGAQPIRIRAGLHSGPAIVGNIGAPGRVNYTLIGDTVNTAQRLEAFGKAYMKDEDTSIILVSGECAALIGEAFTLTALEEEVLRGRSEATKIFRLLEQPAS